MAYCSNCGHQISDQAVACPNCGHPGPGRGVSIDFGPVASAPYADYGKRVGAYLIDLIIILAIIGILFAAGAASSMEGFFLLGILFAGASLLYKPLLEGSRGQTLGKMAVGIKVVRAADAGPIGYGEAFLRWLIAAVIGFVPFGSLVDLLWPLWDAHKQTLHDKVAKTIVVDVS